MKKLIGMVSIFVLSLFASSVFASEPQMEQSIWDEPQATLETSQEPVLEDSQSAVEQFAVWPFESIEKKSPEDTGGGIDKVNVDQSVDEDGMTSFLIGLDDPIVESD